MTGYEIINYKKEKCPECFRDMVELRVFCFGTIEYTEDAPKVVKCLNCEPDIKKDIILNMTALEYYIKNMVKSEKDAGIVFINTLSENKQNIKNLDDITTKLSGEVINLAKKLKALENK